MDPHDGSGHTLTLAPAQQEPQYTGRCSQLRWVGVSRALRNQSRLNESEPDRILERDGGRNARKDRARPARALHPAVLPVPAVGSRG